MEWNAVCRNVVQCEAVLVALILGVLKAGDPQWGLRVGLQGLGSKGGVQWWGPMVGFKAWV